MVKMIVVHHYNMLLQWIKHKEQHFKQFLVAVGNDNDQTTSGELWLYGISSTTFVKHFMSTCSLSNPSNYMHNFFSAGYFNVTSALDEFQFKMSSGNIDAGKIKLYGIKDS
jgi:hypothetical protein